MSKHPAIILPFVNWPGASPKDRAALLTFWTNVILAAASRQRLASEIEIIEPGRFPPRPEQTEWTPNPICEWYDDCCRSFDHPAPPALGRRIRYTATSSNPWPGEWSHICEKCLERLKQSGDGPWEWEEPGLFLKWKKSARGNYWAKVRDTHIVVFKRTDQLWGARVQRDGCRARYLKTTSDYPDRLLHSLELSFGKPADLNNRAALIDFTIDDFNEVLARDPMIVAARLEEERTRANGFAGYEAD